MATVTAYSAERMKAIEDATVVGGSIEGDELVLARRDGTPINAGNVRGPQGLKGDTGETGATSIVICTRATRPTGTARYEGLMIYETDTDQLFSFNGSVWKYEGGPMLVTSSSRPTSTNILFEGLVIFETDTKRWLVRSNSKWIGLAAGAGIRPSDFFNYNMPNATGTAFSNCMTQLDIFTTPVPIRMWVTFWINAGGGGTANTIVHWRVQDNSLVVINTGGWGGSQRSQRFAAVGEENLVSFMARKDYAAGASVGFNLQYMVSTGNIYQNIDARVDYEPLLT